MGNDQSVAAAQRVQQGQRPSGLSDNPVLADRQIEELVFRGETTEKIPPNVIQHTRMKIDKDGDVVFTAFTPTGAYAVIILLDHCLEKVNWVQCKCLHLAFKVVERGTELNLDIMKSCAETFQKLGVANVKKQGSTNVLVVRPADRPCNYLPLSILPLKLQVDPSNNLRFTFGINQAGEGLELVANITVVLRVSPDTAGGLPLSIFECKALADMFFMFETGDKVSEQMFLALLCQFRQRYNQLVYEVQKSETGFPIYNVQISPTRVENKSPIDPKLLQALAAVTQQPSPVAQGGATNPNDFSKLQYPGLTIGSLISDDSGFGVVYRGTYQGKDVAIKIFKDERGDAADYKSELKALLKAGDHPHVIQILEFFETPRPCIVMKFISGGTLTQYLTRLRDACRSGRPEDIIKTKDAVCILVGIAKGLLHLHTHSIIHRDMKSHNVLMQGSDPVIIDLGLGTQWGNGQTTGVGVTQGTLPWMAPEMIDGGKFSDKTDVYAFGVIMWEVMSAASPYSDLQLTVPQLLRDVSLGTLRPTLKLCGTRPDWLINLMKSAWCNSARSRPSMKDILDTLETGGSATQMDWEAVFRVVDKDGSGEIELVEFIELLKLLKIPPLKSAELGKLFDAIDTDGGGSVSKDEFASWWAVVRRDGITAALQVGSKLSAPVAVPQAPPPPPVPPPVAPATENSPLKRLNLSAKGTAILADNEVDYEALLVMSVEDVQQLGLPVGDFAKVKALLNRNSLSASS